nr:unnamed protein product [Callosobruchus chinensis]
MLRRILQQLLGKRSYTYSKLEVTSHSATFTRCKKLWSSYCTLSNKGHQSDHLVQTNNQALPRSLACKRQCIKNPVLYAIKQEVPKRALSSNEQSVSAKKSLIQAFRSQHYRKHDLTKFTFCRLQQLLEKKARISIQNQEVLLSRLAAHAARPRAQIRPSLEYCSHIWGAAAPTILSILAGVQLESTGANIVSREEEKRTKYQKLLGQLRRLWLDHAVSLLVMVIGSLGGMRNTLLSALRAMPVCRAAAHILAAKMQKAAIFGSFRLFRAHDSRDETPVLPYAPGDIESVVENERCRIYWNYSFPTLELVQANKPDIVLLDHQQKTMFVIEFSAPAEVNIVSKEEEKRTKYQELLGQLRRLWPDYAVSLLVMVIGSLGGMRNTLLSALRAIPVCRAAAHILAARMQKAVILGSLRLLRAHDTRTQ